MAPNATLRPGPPQPVAWGQGAIPRGRSSGKRGRSDTHGAAVGGNLLARIKKHRLFKLLLLIIHQILLQVRMVPLLTY